MRDLISVLMCVYNTPVLYLKEAAMSIVNQTYNNIEFVIIDDSSDDPEVITFLEELDCNDNRVKLIHNDKNCGLTKSLNIGLSYCHGKYIARMDSDDISLPNRLEIQYDYMEKNREVSLVGSDIICFGDNIKVINKSETDDPFNDLEIYRIRSLLQHSGPPHPTFMFRTEFLRNNDIEYREDILKAQDYGIMANILLAGGSICKIREPLLKYRIHEGQISYKSDLEQQAYQVRISYDFIKALFYELSDEECAAISLLGCEYRLEELLHEIGYKYPIKEVCFFLVKYSCELGNAWLYIRAIKRILRINRKERLFEQRKLETEIRSKWWKRAYRNTIYYNRLWGMGLFTIASYRFCLICSNRYK